MSAVLEATIDKFIFRVPTDRWYTADGMWIQPSDAADETQLRLGVTDFLQQRSGDVAFVTIRPPGTELQVGEDVAEIETVKVNVALPTPVAGTIVAVNPAVDSTPEILNQDPYRAGWLAVIAVSSWDEARQGLLTPEAYVTHVQQQAQREVEPS